MTQELRDQVEWMRLQQILHEVCVYRDAQSILIANTALPMVLNLKNQQMQAIIQDFVKRGIKVPDHLVKQIRETIMSIEGDLNGS